MYILKTFILIVCQGLSMACPCLTTGFHIFNCMKSSLRTLFSENFLYSGHGCIFDTRGYIFKNFNILLVSMYQKENTVHI